MGAVHLRDLLALEATRPMVVVPTHEFQGGSLRAQDGWEKSYAAWMTSQWLFAVAKIWYFKWGRELSTLCLVFFWIRMAGVFSEFPREDGV